MSAVLTAETTKEEKLEAINEALGEETTAQEAPVEHVEAEAAREPEEPIAPVKEKAAPEPKEAPPAPDHAKVDPALATRAIRLGLDYESVQSFPSAAALQRTVEHLESMQKAPEKPAEDEFKLPDDLDPNEFDERLIARDKWYRDTIKKQQDTLQQITKTQGAFTQAQQNAFVEERIGWFDSKLSDLGDEFSAELGKGTARDDLPPAALALRRKVLAMTDVAEFQFGMSRDEAVTGALRFFLGEKYDRRAVANVKNQLQARSRQRTTPGQRQRVDEVTPSDDPAKNPDVIAAWNKMQNERGK